MSTFTSPCLPICLFFTCCYLSSLLSPVSAHNTNAISPCILNYFQNMHDVITTYSYLLSILSMQKNSRRFTLRTQAQTFFTSLDCIILTVSNQKCHSGGHLLNKWPTEFNFYCRRLYFTGFCIFILKKTHSQFQPQIAYSESGSKQSDSFYICNDTFTFCFLTSMSLFNFN